MDENRTEDPVQSHIKETGQDNRDFKYVLADTGSLYLGARYSYEELLEQEMLPFKLKTLIRRYVLPESAADNTLESEFYYLAKDSVLYQIYEQLRVKVKVYMQVEKKGLFGKKKLQYTERILPVKELVQIEPAEKKTSGMIMREVIISKLGLMTFTI